MPSNADVTEGGNAPAKPAAPQVRFYYDSKPGAKARPGEKSMLQFSPTGPDTNVYSSDEQWLETGAIRGHEGDEKIVKLIQREPGAAAELQKWDTWTFGRGGPTVYAGDKLGEPNERHPLKLAIDRDFDNLEYHKHVRFWNTQVLGRGVGLLALGIDDGKRATDPVDPSLKGVNLSFVNVICREAIPDKGIRKGTDPSDPETYGKITGYLLNIPVGQAESPEPNEFPAERFLHWARRGIVGDMYGESIFLPKYNPYRVRAKMRVALGQTLRTNARPISDVTVPDGTPDATYTQIENGIRNLDTLAAFVHEESTGYDLKGTNSALDPGPYVDFNDDEIAMGMGRVIHKGAEAGAIASAEFNLKLFDSVVADWQTHAVTPSAYNSFIDWNIRHKRYPKGYYWLEWPSIRQTTEKEKAEIAQLLAQAFGSIAAGVGALLQAGFKPMVDGVDIWMVSPDGKVQFPVPGLKSTDLPRADARPVQLHPGAHQAIDLDLPPESREKLHKQQSAEWEPHIKPLELEGVTLWNQYFTQFQTDLLAEVKAAWEKYIGPSDTEAAAGTKSLPGQKDEVDFIKALEKFIPKTAEFETAAEDLIDKTYGESYIESGELMGVKVSATALPKDTPGIRKMRQKGATFARDTILQSNRRAQLAINDAISGGSATTDYRQVTQKVSELLGGVSSKFPNTIHKILHEAASESRWDAIEKHTGSNMGVWVSAGDGKERDSPVDHGLLNGTLIDRATSMGGDYLAAFGCRCTVVPQSPYEAAVNKLKEQEGI